MPCLNRRTRARPAASRLLPPTLRDIDSPPQVSRRSIRCLDDTGREGRLVHQGTPSCRAARPAVGRGEIRNEQIGRVAPIELPDLRAQTTEQPQRLPELAMHADRVVAHRMGWVRDGAQDTIGSVHQGDRVQSRRLDSRYAAWSAQHPDVIVLGGHSGHSEYRMEVAAERRCQEINPPRHAHSPCRAKSATTRQINCSHNCSTSSRSR